MVGTKRNKAKNQHGLFSWLKVFHKKKNVVDMQEENEKKARSIPNNNNKNNKSNPTLQTNGVTRSSNGTVSQISSSNETATTYQETEDHPNKNNNNNNDNSIKIKSTNESNLIPSTIITNEQHPDQPIVINNNDNNNKDNDNIDNSHNDEQLENEKNLSETKSKTIDNIKVKSIYKKN